MAPAELKDIQTSLAGLHAKFDAVLNGTRDANGKWIPGLSPEVDDLKRRVGELEDAAESAESRQLNARHAVGLSLLGAAIGQALGWMRDHIK